MTKISWIPEDRPGVIGAFHLPPLMGSQHPAAQPVSVAVDHALRNIEKAVKAGVPAIYLQDLGDAPIATSIQPHAAAALAVVGAAVRREFPDLALGICMMSHGCKEPLADCPGDRCSVCAIESICGRDGESGRCAGRSCV